MCCPCRFFIGTIFVFCSAVLCRDLCSDRCASACASSLSTSLPFLASPGIAIKTSFTPLCGWSFKILSGNSLSEPLKTKVVGMPWRIAWTPEPCAHIFSGWGASRLCHLILTNDLQGAGVRGRAPAGTVRLVKPQAHNKRHKQTNKQCIQTLLS
jgi:hypothetical protein